MFPRSPVAGLAPSTLLLAWVLVGPMAVASPVPFVRPPALYDARSPLPPASVPVRPAPLPLAAGNAADGTWREFNLLQTHGALTVYDQAHDQMLSLGGFQRTDHWALPLAGPFAWQPLPVPASAVDVSPFSSARDPVTGIVYFLADGAGSIELHAFDPQTGAVAATPISGTAPWWLPGLLVFDPVNQRIVVYGPVAPFGGAHEAWAIDLLPAPAWSQWTPSGTPPPANSFSPALLDPVRRHLLLPNFHGYGPGPTPIWALTLDGPPQWLQFTSNGLPAGANYNPIVYDAASDRLWTIDEQGESYSLSLVDYQWSHVPALGTGPAPRSGAGITIDPVRHRLLVSGGATPSGDDTHSDTWALSLDGTPGWTELVPDATRPPIRGGASDGYDASRHRLVVFAGSDELGGYRNDTWVLALGPEPVWSPLATQGTPPPARFWHVSAWDDARDQLVVYGGHGGDGDHPLGDLWALSFPGAMPTWSPITPAGPAPAGRMLSQMVYDSARDRFLLFFGGSGNEVFGDVWELRLSPTPAWRPLAPTGAPPAARSAAMCAYDPGHDRVLIFGGWGQDVYRNDLWALNLAGADGAWQELPVPPGPSPRSFGLLRMDTFRNRLVLFGGYGVHHYEGNNIFVQYLDDAWALNLGGVPAWQPLSPEGFLPPPRDRANGAYDPIHDRLVLACGGAGGSNDLWALAFPDAPTPVLLALASSDVTADRVRLVWAGAEPGTRATVYRREADSEWQSLGTLLADGEGHLTLEDRDVTPGMTLEYRLGVTGDGGEEFLGATRVEIPLRALSLSVRVVDGRASFAVELPSGDPATLALFDLAGRRVWSRPIGELGAGSHEVSTDDAALPAALYFARLTQGEASRFAQVVIVR